MFDIRSDVTTAAERICKVWKRVRVLIDIRQCIQSRANQLHLMMAKHFNLGRQLSEILNDKLKVSSVEMQSVAASVESLAGGVRLLTFHIRLASVLL